MHTDIHFCTSQDGVRLAYAEVGKGPLLVKTANWLNHLEFDWQSPVWEPGLRLLSSRHRLVRYDARGNGLSDWDVAEVSFEAFVHDLETVVDAAKLDRFALYGISQGCAISVAYAVRHPERVSHLILFGGFARGRFKRGSPNATAEAKALEALIRQGWGRESRSLQQAFTALFIPEGTPQQIGWFTDLQRISTTPEGAIRLRRAIDNIEVTGLLSRVTTPTLVMHQRDDLVVPFEEGRQLAAGIPGSRFVPLEGHNHLILEGDPGWMRLHEEIADFLSR